MELFENCLFIWDSNPIFKFVIFVITKEKATINCLYLHILIQWLTVFHYHVVVSQVWLLGTAFCISGRKKVWRNVFQFIFCFCLFVWMLNKLIIKRYSGFCAQELLMVVLWWPYVIPKIELRLVCKTSVLSTVLSLWSL